MQRLPETPAWSGLQPGAASWAPAPPGAAEILARIGRRGTLDCRRHGAGRCGFYRLRAADDRGDLFLKVVPAARARTLWEADRLASWLNDQGLATPALLVPPVQLTAAERLLIYPLIDGRFAKPRVGDLRSLGAALAELHRLLARFPEAERLQQASARRDRDLQAARAQIVGGSALAYRAEVVQDLIAQGPVELPASGAQPLHGDLNSGNLLLTDSHRAVFLDFEDCLHNCHSPTVDLAMAVERFVLVPAVDDHQAVALAKALFGGYRDHGGRLCWTDGEIAGVLRALAVRALLLLSRLQATGRTTAHTEWDKFIWLHQQTDARAALLARLERL